MLGDFGNALKEMVKYGFDAFNLALVEMLTGQIAGQRRWWWPSLSIA